MFEKICIQLHKYESEINDHLKEEPTGNMESLEHELHRYFPQLKEKETSLTRNQFTSFLDVPNIHDK